MKEILTKNVVLNLFISLVFAVLSIFLINSPEVTIKTLTIILGVVILAIGVIKGILYLKRGTDEKEPINVNLLECVVLIIFGISIISFNSFVSTMFRIMIAIWIIYTSIERIVLAIKLKNFEYNLWYIIFISAMLMLICGLYVMFNAGAIIVTIGIVFLIYCIIDIIESIVALSYLSKV